MMLAQTSALAGARVPRRSFAGKKLSAPTNGVKVFAKVANWLPGSDTPAYLENIPGSFGFDPLGLASVPSNLQRFQEAELIHCRWAMAGAAGVLAVEALGFGNWYDAPTWAISGGKATWFGVEVPFDVATLGAVEFVLMAGAEAQRANEPDAEKRKYPGGAFDPLGFSKDAKSLEEYKLKEIKNGRLAMLATLGFLAQHAATGAGPLEALSSHVASPWSSNFATNGVSLPF
jgi:light-harvesting complex I chlorophyll a/b binding protein 1